MNVVKNAKRHTVVLNYCASETSRPHDPGDWMDRDGTVNISGLTSSGCSTGTGDSIAVQDKTKVEESRWRSRGKRWMQLGGGRGGRKARVNPGQHTVHRCNIDRGQDCGIPRFTVRHHDFGVVCQRGRCTDEVSDRLGTSSFVTFFPLFCSVGPPGLSLSPLVPP